MIRCEICESHDGRPVFRTRPKGGPPGWTCQVCIDGPRPDEDVVALVDIIDEPRRARRGEWE